MNLLVFEEVSQRRVDQVAVVKLLDGESGVLFVSFLVGCGGQVQASKEEILSDITELWAGRYDARLLTVALVLGLVEMGWNLSLAASEGSPAARAGWQWWVDAARRSADTGLIG